MKNRIKKILDRLPYIRSLKAHIELLEAKNRQLFVPPGHFYSPIISEIEILPKKDLIWGRRSNLIEGIDLNETYQLELLNELLKYYSELPFNDTQTEGLRYYYENIHYSYSDAIFLFCMIRKFKPRRIIEVGSGFSSAVMLDTNKLFFDGKIDCTFIEPYPERLKKLLHVDDRINLIESPVQEVDIRSFEKLSANDILFIDSTHVAKTGSDVNFLFFEIFPRLSKGVKIHVHDIFYPFEYPIEWVIDQKRSWNEDYLLRAFLMYNDNYKIIAFNTYLEELHENWFKANMPLCLRNKGGSLWMEVV